MKPFIILLGVMIAGCMGLLIQAVNNYDQLCEQEGFACVFAMLRDLWNKVAWYIGNFTLGCVVLGVFFILLIGIGAKCFDLHRKINRIYKKKRGT